MFSQKYFQQYLKYNIQVELDTTNKTLKGNITIIYHNNSYDTLKYIYFHLYPNSTSHRTKTALAKQLLQNNDWSLYFSSPEDRGYIDSLNFKINNIKANYKTLKDSPDIAILYLNNPLYPGDSIQITTPFFVKIPTCCFTRMGYYKDIYAITQWYPKPVVYDYQGWHPYPYLSFGEFYSEFAYYKVTIKVPSNITVAATGKLLTENERKRIEKIYANSKQNITTVDTTKGYKTLVFEQDFIHDFAWFASKSFMISKDSIIINNKKIYCWAYYTPESHNLWQYAAKYVAVAIKYYSENLGPYPFDICTSVETPKLIDGGMEYPTITNIGKVNNTYELQETILHEVGHNWLYGILANNERKYPWIDEGINSYYDKATSNTSTIYYSNTLKDWQDFFKLTDINSLPNLKTIDFVYFAGYARPIGLKSELYNGKDYFFNVYYNASNNWFLLKEYSTKELYYKFIKDFYNNYSFKHIYPNDIKQSLEKTTNKNYDWFFNDILYSTKRSDYKIKKIKTLNENKIIIIKNKTNIFTPYTITLYKNDTPIFSQIREGCKSDTIIFPQKIDKAIINDQDNSFYFFEKNYQNNIYNDRFFLPRFKQLSIRPLGLIDYQKKYDIIFAPIATYTNTDKQMLGILLYTPVVPYSPTQIRILPLYAIEKKQFNYNFHAEHNFLFNQQLRYIKISIDYKQFLLPKNNYSTHWKSYTTTIELPYNFYSQLSEFSLTPYFKYNLSNYYFAPSKTYHHFIFGFNYKGKLKNIYPLNTNILNETTKQFYKIGLTNTLVIPYMFIKYNKKRRDIIISHFIGSFLLNNSNYYVYNFFLSGRNSIIDYTYSNTYINRFETIYDHSFWSHQFELTEGMFTTYVPINSNKWLTSLRNSIQLPIPAPINFYFTIATCHNAKKFSQNSTWLFYEAGFEINLIKDIFAIYFPVTMSPALKDLSDKYSRNYFDKVRFMLQLNMLNPFINIRKIYDFF